MTVKKKKKKTLNMKWLNKIFYKLYSSGKKKFSAVVCVSLAAAVFFTGVKYISNSRENTMVLTLNYADSRNGLTPGGARFNIADIKSDEVLQGAIDILDDDSLSIENLKSSIVIDTKMPKSSVERTVTAIASDSSYSYCPSEFEIHYNKSNFSKNNADQFLAALAESYRKYFDEHHAITNVALDYTEENWLEDYDYNEICQMLKDKVSTMLRYLDKYESESGTYRAKSTGYSFANISTMILNIRDVDLVKLDAYITQNHVAKDKDEFLRKQEYSVDKKTLNYNKMQMSSDISNHAMDIYNAHITGVAFIPSVDQKNEFYMSRTKTGLDTLVTKSHNDGISATKLLKTINEHNYLISKYSDVPASTEEANATAAAMISEISNYLSKVSALAMQTDKDYIEQKTNNYITFIFNERPMSGYIKTFGVSLIAAFVLLTIAVNKYGVVLEWFKKQKDELVSEFKPENEE